MPEVKLYFQCIYEENYHDLLRYLVIQTRSVRDVEDILQNAYAKFYRRICKRGYGDIENPRAYLMGVVQRELKSYYRFRLLRQNHEVDTLPEDGALPAPLCLEDAAVNRDTLKRIWGIVAAAPALSAKAFVLRYYFGHSEAETAKLLGLTESSVTSRIFRLRRTIRQQMEKE